MGKAVHNWTPATIIAALREINGRGELLTTRNVRRYNSGLDRAVVREFGCYGDAIRAALAVEPATVGYRTAAERSRGTLTREQRQQREATVRAAIAAERERQRRLGMPLDEEVRRRVVAAAVTGKRPKFGYF